MGEEMREDCCGHDHKHGSVQPSASGSISVNSSLSKEGLVESVFHVSGMDCADEVTAIQAALRITEVAEVNANLMAGTVAIQHHSSISRARLVAKVESAGVKVRSEGETSKHFISKLRVLLVVLSGAFAGIGMGFEWLVIPTANSLSPFYVISVACGGYLVFPKAWRSLRQLRLDINVLMAAAVVGAFAIKEFSEGAVVIFLFALSELLESYSVVRARRAIREVMDLTPDTAFLLAEGAEANEVHLSSIKIGDRVLVKSGGRIPIDGTVARGASLVNQAPLTGESIPVEKKVGDSVFAGTLNESGAIEVVATKVAEDTKASQIARMIEEAQRDKAPAQRFVDSFARYYTPGVFLLALIVLLVPPLAMHADWEPWVYRSLVLLVIACPCALVISTPVSIVSGLAAMAKRGVLVKGGVHLETLGRIRGIAVDKTGTLTHGRPAVQKVTELNGTPENRLLQIALSLEAQASHPLADAIIRHAKEKNVQPLSASDFNTVPGFGVEASIGGHLYFLGNHRFAHDFGVCTAELEAILGRMEDDALSVVVVGHRPHKSCAGEVFGVIGLGDEIRDNARAAVQSLRNAGIQRVVMLSGDNQKTANAIAKKAGIEEAKGDLLPEDKAREMKRLVEELGAVAMIGDGINDAPALAQSSLGIAMGAAGTDTAIETADVALMQDDLGQVATAIKQGRRVLSVIRFNIGAALLVKAVFLALALAGHTNLWLAVAADTGTSLLVVANALRLLWIPA